MTLDLITLEDRAEIAEQSAALVSLLSPRPAWMPDPLWDRLKRVAAWSVAYARDPQGLYRHYIRDAADDLPAWQASSDTPGEAMRLIAQAVRVADVVAHAVQPVAGAA